METAIEDVTWQQDLSASARRLSAGVVAGAAMGGLIGGLGGRLAMFVLRLTSTPKPHGLETDDGFTMGVFSRFTFFLVIVTAVLGILGGIGYLAVRAWLPVAWRAGLTGAFGGIVGGAAFIHPGGIDFKLLAPLPLAVVIFIALPAIYGMAMSRLIERRLKTEPGGSLIPFVGLIPLVLMAFVGPRGLAVVVALPGLFVLHRAAPGVADVWRSASVVWLGRAALLGVTGVALVALIRDVADVL